MTCGVWGQAAHDAAGGGEAAAAGGGAILRGEKKNALCPRILALLSKESPAEAWADICLAIFRALCVPVLSHRILIHNEHTVRS